MITTIEASLWVDNKRATMRTVAGASVVGEAEYRKEGSFGARSEEEAFGLWALGFWLVPTQARGNALWPVT